MGAESLPIVCGACREPLRWKGGTYYERASGDQHFIGNVCPVVKGLEEASRAVVTGVDQGGTSEEDDEAVNEPQATAEQAQYWKGVMDGIAMMALEHPEYAEEARTKVAAMKHVHYCSIIGPYCVICRINMPAPYNDFWSEG